MKVHVSSLHAPIYKNFYLCIGGKKSNAQIEIFITWCMERGHMNLQTSLSLFAILVLFPVIVMQSEKNPHVPLLRGNPPLDGESPS